MSGRIHECPKCGAVWYCEGCFTREEIRNCDNCTDACEMKKFTIQDAALLIAKNFLKD